MSERSLHARGRRRRRCAARRRGRASSARRRGGSDAIAPGLCHYCRRDGGREGPDPRPRGAARPRRPLDPRQPGARVQGLQHEEAVAARLGVGGLPRYARPLRRISRYTRPSEIVGIDRPRLAAWNRASSSSQFQEESGNEDDAMAGGAGGWRCGVSVGARRSADDKPGQGQGRTGRGQHQRGVEGRAHEARGRGPGRGAEDHRLPRAHGPFKKAQDLEKVDGVGKGVIEKNAGRIAVK